MYTLLTTLTATLIATMADNKIKVNIKFLSGEVLPLEIDSQISHSDFISSVFASLVSLDIRFHNIRFLSFSQLSISRFVENEFVSIEPLSKLLLPQPDETFYIYIDPSSYSVRISLSSTEVWDDNRTRYDLFTFHLQEYNGSTFNIISQGIYAFTNTTSDTTSENILFFLENDKIPAELFGRFGDEWEIHIPEDMKPLRGIQELVNYSPIGKGLSEAGKERIIYMLSEKFNKYLDVKFNRDKEEEEDLRYLMAVERWLQ